MKLFNQFRHLRNKPLRSDVRIISATNKDLRESVQRGISRKDLDRSMILETLEKTENHQTKAAQRLWISERILRYKLDKYGLKKPEDKPL